MQVIGTTIFKINPYGMGNQSNGFSHVLLPFSNEIDLL